MPIHSVLIAAPTHGSLPDRLDYVHPIALPAGQVVRVPLGQREVLGVVWERDGQAGSEVDADRLKPIAAVYEGLSPLPQSWRDVIAFTARYYQRSAGEVAMAALPPHLRLLKSQQVSGRLAAYTKKLEAAAVSGAQPQHPAPVHSAEQAQALATMAQEAGPFVLFGSTGSGKTEVYFSAIANMLAQHPEGQALVMVPEINLTPQLLLRVEERFGSATIAQLHSGLTPAQRLQQWLKVHTGKARIVLGTRMAVLASFSDLKLLVVDEEHDPSYKQQEGARYSARDLAVYRGQRQGAKVILGSATPSLESWHLSDPDNPRRRYTRIGMPSRIGGASLPQVHILDTQHLPKDSLLAKPLLAAIKARLEQGQQCLFLLNRRGFAPALHCHSCGWKSDCPNCSAMQVFHKSDRSLRCHHCGASQRVPRACPACGNPDIQTVGMGTEQLQERLMQALADLRRPDGLPPLVARIDADSARSPEQLSQQLAQVHRGDVDILVGTQMIAKGHDFRRMGLIAVLQADASLYSNDFRATERLFALLLQAAGRAGRDGAQGSSEMWVQTHHPEHLVYQALRRHDYPLFAHACLQERKSAEVPPWSHQALLRAEARTLEEALAFLQATLQTQAGDSAELLRLSTTVTLYAPVPMGMQRIANVERAQLLVESSSRLALQAFLSAWQDRLHRLTQGPAHKRILRWALDVDPQQI